MATTDSSPLETPTPSSTIIIPGAELVYLHVFHSTIPHSVQLIQPMPELVIVKLDDDNSLTWKQQVLTAIRGYGLENVIIRTSVVPPGL